VQIFTLRSLPSSMIRRCCTFTANRRLVCRFEWLTLLPYCGLRKHTSQRAAIDFHPFTLSKLSCSSHPLVVGGTVALSDILRSSAATADEHQAYWRLNLPGGHFPANPH
jgi:hypothetical protein